MSYSTILKRPAPTTAAAISTASVTGKLGCGDHVDLDNLSPSTTYDIAAGTTAIGKTWRPLTTRQPSGMSYSAALRTKASPPEATSVPEPPSERKVKGDLDPTGRMSYSAILKAAQQLNTGIDAIEPLTDTDPSQPHSVTSSGGSLSVQRMLILKQRRPLKHSTAREHQPEIEADGTRRAREDAGVHAETEGFNKALAGISENAQMPLDLDCQRVSRVQIQWSTPDSAIANGSSYRPLPRGSNQSATSLTGNDTIALPAAARHLTLPTMPHRWHVFIIHPHGEAPNLTELTNQWLYRRPDQPARI